MASWHHGAEEPMWVYPPINIAWRDAIANEFNIHPILAQILVSRHFNSLDQVHDYLYAKLPDLHNPSGLSDMKRASVRVFKAIAEAQPIMIYGDNDVDGMTGTALLTEFLQNLGAKVHYFVTSPGSSRQKLIIESLEKAQSHGCKLLITVDCGVTAYDEIAQVISCGIDVIITDHHEVTDKLPGSCIILNPKLEGEEYPNRDLTGVGVAFKLAHAVTNELALQGSPLAGSVDLKSFLDLVAMGTISDMGALRGENRILVRYGLMQLQQTKRIGLRKLLSLSDIDLNVESVTTYMVASKISPRLNSLGRISDPHKGVELLLIHDETEAERLAQELDLHNLERQRIERTMSQEVEQRLQQEPELLSHKAIVLAGEQWHPGIIAILSARISKYYNRPTLIISIENGIGKGSIRSIPEFPVLNLLKSCSDLLMTFGGHDLAAGLTLKAELIPLLTEKFLKAADLQLTANDVINKLYLDAEVNLHDMTFELLEAFNLLAPYGNENPQPVLYCFSCRQAWPARQVGRHHLRMYLEDPKSPGMIIEGIAHGRAYAQDSLRKKNQPLQVAFTPMLSEHIGPSINLNIRDFKINL